MKRETTGCEPEQVGLRKLLKGQIYSDVRPMNKRWVLCYLETEKTKRKGYASAFYDGQYWNSDREDASGIEGGKVGDCWEVKEWMYLEGGKK